MARVSEKSLKHPEEMTPWIFLLYWFHFSNLRVGKKQFLPIEPRLRQWHLQWHHQWGSAVRGSNNEGNPNVQTSIHQIWASRVHSGRTNLVKPRGPWLDGTFTEAWCDQRIFLRLRFWTYADLVCRKWAGGLLNIHVSSAYILSCIYLHIFLQHFKQGKTQILTDFHLNPFFSRLLFSLQTSQILRFPKQ